MTRTIVVTGAGSGIGAAAAQLMKDRGYRVVGVDLKNADVQADLSTPDGRVVAAKEAISAAGGTVDAVIAAAGIAAPTSLTVAVNFFGVTEFLAALQPALASSDSPRAVVVSSMATLQPVSDDLVDAMLAGNEAKAREIGDALAQRGPETGYLNYPSSKRALSRWVRRESITPMWAGANIPLNAVAPGTVLTPMTTELLSSDQGRAMVDGAVPMPLNYHQKPEVIADLMAWLVSEENTHVTGQTIYIDGGADASLRGDNIW
ncbi:MAG: SDR family oxidoreductase [Terrimesophilobacter sp.]